jgi:hypothetical protein
VSPESAQLEREAQAWAAFILARAQGDMIRAQACWRAYAEIHGQRPREMVEKLERERGLR